MNQHKIQRVVFSYEFNDLEHRESVDAFIKEMTNSVEFEKVFEKNETDVLIEIQRLEIDLGDVEFQELKSAFLDVLENQLKARIRSAESDTGVKIKKIYEWIDQFLFEGSIPWWSKYATSSEELLMFLKTLEKDDFQNAKVYFSNIFSQEIPLSRMAYQFNDEELEVILSFFLDRSEMNRMLSHSSASSAIFGESYFVFLVKAIQNASSSEYGEILFDIFQSIQDKSAVDENDDIFRNAIVQELQNEGYPIENRQFFLGKHGEGELVVSQQRGFKDKFSLVDENSEVRLNEASSSEEKQIDRLRLFFPILLDYVMYGSISSELLLTLNKHGWRGAYDNSTEDFVQNIFRLLILDFEDDVLHFVFQHFHQTRIRKLVFGLTDSDLVVSKLASLVLSKIGYRDKKQGQSEIRTVFRSAIYQYSKINIASSSLSQGVIEANLLNTINSLRREHSNIWLYFSDALKSLKSKKNSPIWLQDILALVEGRVYSKNDFINREEASSAIMRGVETYLTKGTIPEWMLNAIFGETIFAGLKLNELSFRHFLDLLMLINQTLIPKALQLAKLSDALSFEDKSVILEMLKLTDQNGSIQTNDLGSDLTLMNKSVSDQKNPEGAIDESQADDKLFEKSLYQMLSETSKDGKLPAYAHDLLNDYFKISKSSVRDVFKLLIDRNPGLALNVLSDFPHLQHLVRENQGMIDICLNSVLSLQTNVIIEGENLTFWLKKIFKVFQKEGLFEKSPDIFDALLFLLLDAKKGGIRGVKLDLSLRLWFQRAVLPYSDSKLFMESIYKNGLAWLDYRCFAPNEATLRRLKLAPVQLSARSEERSKRLAIDNVTERHEFYFSLFEDKNSKEDSRELATFDLDFEQLAKNIDDEKLLLEVLSAAMSHYFHFGRIPDWFVSYQNFLDDLIERKDGEGVTVQLQKFFVAKDMQRFKNLLLSSIYNQSSKLVKVRNNIHEELIESVVVEFIEQMLDGTSNDDLTAAFLLLRNAQEKLSSKFRRTALSLTHNLMFDLLIYEVRSKDKDTMKSWYMRSINQLVNCFIRYDYFQHSDVKHLSIELNDKDSLKVTESFDYEFSSFLSSKETYLHHVSHKTAGMLLQYAIRDTDRVSDSLRLILTKPAVFIRVSELISSNKLYEHWLKNDRTIINLTDLSRLESYQLEKDLSLYFSALNQEEIQSKSMKKLSSEISSFLRLSDTKLVQLIGDFSLFSLVNLQLFENTIRSLVLNEFKSLSEDQIQQLIFECFYATLKRWHSLLEELEEQNHFDTIRGLIATLSKEFDRILLAVSFSSDQRKALSKLFAKVNQIQDQKSEEDGEQNAEDVDRDSFSINIALRWLADQKRKMTSLFQLSTYIDKIIGGSEGLSKLLLNYKLSSHISGTQNTQDFIEEESNQGNSTSVQSLVEKLNEFSPEKLDTISSAPEETHHLRDIEAFEKLCSIISNPKYKVDLSDLALSLDIFKSDDVDSHRILELILSKLNFGPNSIGLQDCFFEWEYYLNYGVLPWWGRFKEKKGLVAHIIQLSVKLKNRDEVTPLVRGLFQRNPYLEKRFLDYLASDNEALIVNESKDLSNEITSQQTESDLKLRFDDELFELLPEELEDWKLNVIGALPPANSENGYSERYNRLSRIRELLKDPDSDGTILRIFFFTNDCLEYLSQEDGVDNSDLIFDDELSSQNDEFLKHEWLDLSENQRIYLPNAGVILLWPFFQRLFQRLSYLEKGEFVNYESQVKAVFVLQYLINEAELMPEHLLILNKVLVGLDGNDVIPRSYSLTDLEKKECEMCLQTIIKQWKQMKNTSIATFRRTFLQRGGFLEFRNDNKCFLLVEKAPIDVLLSTLPWGLSIVKFPWSKILLFVEWSNKK